MKKPNDHSQIVRILTLVSALGAILVWPGGAHAADNYKVTLSGAPSDIAGRLRGISSLAQERRPYPTKATIQRAGRNDVAALRRAMISAGYFTADVEFTLQQADEPTQKSAAVFTINPGPKFTFDEHQIIYVDAAKQARPATPAALGITLQNTATGTNVQANMTAIRDALFSAGYPNAKTIGHSVTVTNASAGHARVVYELATGPKATFGNLTFTGTVRTRTGFLEKLKEWQTGKDLDRSKLVDYQDRLIATNIFQSVEVSPGVPNETGAAPILVDLEERKPRTLGAGLSFSTAQGVGGRLYLEHRNVFGAGEMARADINATEIEQSIRMNFSRPFPALAGTLFFETGFINQTTDAFDARTVNIAGGASKRWLDGRLETRGGLYLEASRIDEGMTQERPTIVGVPLSVVWVTEADPLALRKGTRASVNITPNFGTDVFTKVEFQARSRRNIGANDRFTIAGRFHLGSLFGTSLDSIPINKRFFSGGGSSIRGYDFQAAGPLDLSNTPIGGRSIIEAALEARAMIRKNVQIAAFVDTGTISSRSTPDFSGDYFTGVGAGARFFSPLGPLRVDVAFPLERRPTDRAWQLYISLGQPF